MNLPVLSSRVAGLLLPLLLFLLLVLVWYAVTALWSIPAFILPSPAAVLEAVKTNLPRLAAASLLTAAAAATGFMLSFGVGCLIAFAFAQSPLVRRSCYPYAIFLQTVPIIAIAPLIILWFGTGFQSVVIVSFIISLFPIITNATAGLTSLDRDLVALFDTYNASRLDLLLKLRLPAAVPSLITGAKVSSGLSVIGAIVGEFFAGYGAEHYGLGYIIILTSGQLKTAYLFAAILASTLLGMLIFGLVGLVGDAILDRWYQDRLQT
jgi:NitT/TauT family transport system permease protein